MKYLHFVKGAEGVFNDFSSIISFYHLHHHFARRRRRRRRLLTLHSVLFSYANANGIYGGGEDRAICEMVTDSRPVGSGRGCDCERRERERERENGKKGGRRKVGKRVLCSAEAASRGVRERERESTARPGKSRTFRFLGGWTRRARVDIVLDR